VARSLATSGRLNRGALLQFALRPSSAIGRKFGRYATNVNRVWPPWLPNGASDPDPFHPTRKIRLTMGHIIDKSKGGKDDPSNLRAVCNNCNEGLQNTALPKPDQVWLLSQVRRATVDDQVVLLNWLLTKFGKKLAP
jgi:hypothetical protein